MRIRELFADNVARDIPPVVYFHEQRPEKLAAEVSEYIITGGYPDDDPRARRVRSGIHEQLVQLLRELHREMEKPGGPGLPASWISGFYGSGKSSFAKLVGLALDGAVLPDKTTLADALLRRDESPRRAELAEAWSRLRAKVDPLAVVFDIGSVARDNEHIHSAVLRQVQARLGYCSKSNLVAEHELKLELDGEWDQFTFVAQRALKRPWEKAKHDEQVDDHFSFVLHEMKPEVYPDAMSWIDSRAGARQGIGSSVEEVSKAVASMLDRRAAGKTLFVVVDEVSQYIHQDDSRMLKLQSFVSDLGQRLKGRVWLFATGQQKLEDNADARSIGKLKDRFPASLRVHLATTNIRDVVHKRLLRKAPANEGRLRELFQRHRADLKLHAFDCDDITEEDFVEVYPLLPGHIDLLMQIASSLRSRSTRVQGDDHAIRGLLQLLGELFRAQQLGERDVGDLVTLDAIFEVQQSALDADVQMTLARLFGHPDVREDALAIRAAKAVALLELIQEQAPTTVELVAKCLYQRLGQGNQTAAVDAALERLRAANLLSFSEKTGYAIQSSAGQEWQREREDVGVHGEQLSELVREKLKELLAQPDRPKLKGQAFPFMAWFSDGKHAADVRLQDPRVDAAVTIDFRFLGSKDERVATTWVQRSDQEPLRDRLVWVVGDPGSAGAAARELGKSKGMLRKYQPRKESLPREKQHMLLAEQSREEELSRQLGDILSAAFLDGAVYFRGRPLRPRDFATAFGPSLHGMATRVLPELYPHFTEIAVTETELAQLLEPILSGPSTKFLEKGLGILSLDAGRYVATCSGSEPSRILEFLTSSGGAPGATVIAQFGRPPYGYPADVVRACLAGLLRAGRIRIRPEEGAEITSIKDPGTRDLFRRERDLRRADIFPPKEQAITPRDRVAICAFFAKYFQVELERENDAIADAVFNQFPARRARLRDVEALVDRLPGRPPLPPALDKLGRALEDCRRSRQVEDTVVAVKKQLEVLADGLDQLAIFVAELTDAAIKIVADAAEARDHHAAQLRNADEHAEVEADITALARDLGTERPWRAAAELEDAADHIRAHYSTVRAALLKAQEREVEAARVRVKARTGFTKLDPDKSHQVLRPLAEVVVNTTPDAVAPTLVELRDRFAGRLKAAEERANDLLDDLLVDEVPVVKVEARLQGREVSTPQELKQVLADLEERVSAQLAKGARVRIV